MLLSSFKFSTSHILQQEARKIGTPTSLNQDVTHGFDVLVPVIWRDLCFVPTSVRVIMVPSCAKANSGITGMAVIFLVSKDTDSCSGIWVVTTNCIEAFLVTVGLHGSLWANQRLPCVTTQWGGAVFSISNQWVQSVGMLVDNNEVDLMADPHTQADFREACVPVGRQFGLVMVKTSFSSWKVEAVLIAPEFGIVMKAGLHKKEHKSWSKDMSHTDSTFQASVFRSWISWA